MPTQKAAEFLEWNKGHRITRGELLTSKRQSIVTAVDMDDAAYHYFRCSCGSVRVLSFDDSASLGEDFRPVWSSTPRYIGQ